MQRGVIAVAVAFALGACGRSPVQGRYGGADGGGFIDSRPGPDSGDPAAGYVQNCEQVDFLFVIDNSGSMANNQARLAANYSVFVRGIQEALEPLESVHVGVVTTDAYQHNASGCRELGALVTQTGGSSSSRARCGPYAEGRNFMTDADDLDEAFPCAAKVGTEGAPLESILGAPISALNAPLTDTGDCNEGFLRSGALLVVVVVTDEDIELDPVFASAEILSRKRGGSDDIVVVALGQPSDGTCGLGGTDARAFGLESFTDLFQHGFFGPICGDYSDVLGDAVDAVLEACPGNE